MNDARRTLITGGAGFIGRALATTLVDRGATVASFDLADPGLGGVEAVRGDLSAWADVLEAVSAFRPERIFHCGALLSSIAEADVRRAVRTNADGIFNVLEAGRLFGVSQVIFTSTTATYGAGVADPVPEGAPQRPATIYGVTKVYGERLGEYYAQRYDLDFRGVRLPSVVGPGRGSTGVSAYTSLMIEEPARGRPFVVPVAEPTAMPILYVDEGVRALLELSAAPPPPRAVYNLAGLSPTAAAIAAAVRASVPQADLTFRPDPASQAVVDSWPVAMDDSPAHAEWGWATELDLEGLVKTFVSALGL